VKLDEVNKAESDRYLLHFMYQGRQCILWLSHRRSDVRGYALKIQTLCLYVVSGQVVLERLQDLSYLIFYPKTHTEFISSRWVRTREVIELVPTAKINACTFRERVSSQAARLEKNKRTIHM
jgi:hypothetical protein